MKKYFGKANIALIIAMMFILAFFGGEAMKTHTIDGSASNLYVGSALDKVENDYTVAEPEEAPNQELDISIEQSLNLTLGEWYSSDGKYANPTIPVYTIQKTRSDTENMVILICGEGYTKISNKNLSMTSKRCGREQCSTSHIVVMQIALMSMHFARSQSLASTVVVVHFSTWL